MRPPPKGFTIGGMKASSGFSVSAVAALFVVAALASRGETPAVLAAPPPPAPATLPSTTLPSTAPAAAARPFAIEVVDDRTGRGVPLVELQDRLQRPLLHRQRGTGRHRRPGPRRRTVYFHVSSPGYEFPADGFGQRGRKVDVTPGGSVRLTLHRLNIAERLYRVTGEGVYRDSVMLGRPAPITPAAAERRGGRAGLGAVGRLPRQGLLVLGRHDRAGPTRWATTGPPVPPANCPARAAWTPRPAWTWNTSPKRTASADPPCPTPTTAPAGSTA